MLWSSFACCEPFCVAPMAGANSPDLPPATMWMALQLIQYSHHAPIRTPGHARMMLPRLGRRVARQAERELAQ